MDCGDLNRLMDAFLDRELSAARAEELEAHLASCAHCRRQWAGLVQLLADPEPVEVPRGLGTRIVTAWESRQSAVQAATQAQPWWSGRLTRLRSALAVAACLLFFITGWLLSGWWTHSLPGDVLVENGSAPAPVVNVVVSPWILSSLAQAAAMPAPMSPAVMLACGVLPEMAAVDAETDEPMPRIHQRPHETTTRPADVGTGPGMPLLPLVPRYLGA